MKPAPEATAHMLSMAQWLAEAIATGHVSALSVVLIDESEGIAIPRHTFFAVPGSFACLAGGYVQATHEIAQRMAEPPVPIPNGVQAEPVGAPDHRNGGPAAQPAAQGDFEFEEFAPPEGKPN